MATTRNSLFAALALAFSATAFAQTAPSAVPVPFTTAAIGVGSSSTTVCSASIAATDGTQLGDGCPGPQARLAAPQGAAVDKYGNVYVADYNDKQVRVVYNGNPALAAAITAANSGYAISSSRNAPAVTPVVGNVYTIAGLGPAGVAAFTASGNACANYATSGQPTGLNTLGDGCPGASAPVAARDVKPDADGNLFITDYSNGRIRVFCVNCATTTLAAKLITLENPTVTAPANGAMYTIAGFASGYRDAAPGYNSASNVAGATAAQNIALLRAPTGAVVSSSDDVFIADNTNNAVRVLYNGGTVAKNILAAQGTTAPVQGYVYTIAGAGCVSAATNKTGSVSTANACLTTTNSDSAVLGNANGSSVVWSIYLDGNSNVFYTDNGNARIKMIYGGIAPPVTLPSATYPTLQVGYTYTFAGQGTGVAGTQNGVAPSALVLNAAESIGGDAYGNLFFADYGTGLFYEVYATNGIAAIIGGNANAVATPAPGANCNGLTTGPTMTDAFYNGCPATQAKFTSTRGPVVADASGNLYFGDAIGYYVRKFTYNPTFPTTNVGLTALPQQYAFEFLSASAITSVAVTPSDFVDAGGDTCTTALSVAVGAPGTTCVVNASFTPKQPGARPGAITLNGATGVLGSTQFSGVGNGAALALDPATLTTTGTGYAPAGVAVGPTGSVYFTDLTGKKAVRYTGSTATTIATGFNTPIGIAADNAGNVFISDSTNNNLTAVPNTGGSQYVVNSQLSGPRQVTTDSLGRIYVVDSGNNRIVEFGAGGTQVFTVLPFTGLSAPTGVAVDSAFNVYASDLTHILKLTPLGVQTTVATQSGLTGLAVDAAGDLYSGSGTSLVEFTPAGSKATLYSTLGNANGVAIDSTGNLYVADNGLGGFDTLARTAGFYKFGSSSGTVGITLTSIGTTPVSTTAFTASNTTDYSVVASTTNGCSGALAAGTFCGLTATYSQVTPGIPTDVLSFSATVTNGTPTFTLTAASSAPAITVTAAPASIAFGGTETLKATVYGPGNTGGTVTFYSSGTKIGTATSDSNATGTLSYTPTAVGTYTITADYTPVGASSASVTTGTAATFVVTQATPTISLVVSPATGFATSTYTATATVSSSAGTPGGTVTFKYGSTTLGTGTLSAGVATATFTNLPIGTDCITATYASTTNYASVTSTCFNVTVVTAVTPTISLVVTPTSAYTNSTLTATATVTSTVGSPTGTVSFYNGSTLLGTGTLTAGVATATFTNLPVGTDCITAVYTATTNFTAATSACANVTVSAAFAITPSTTSLAFQPSYQEAQSTLSIVTGGRTDTLTFACTNLPAKLACNFSPSSVKLAGGTATVQVQMLVANSAATYGAVAVKQIVTYALGPFAALALFGLRRRKRFATLMLAIFALLGAASLSGCSSQDPTTLQVASGSYNFSLVVSSGSTTVQTIPFTLNVP